MSEKFKAGDRVALVQNQYGRPLEQCQGIVDGYEYYHGRRVWIKGDDALYYAYPEEDLALIKRDDDAFNGYEYMVQQSNIGGEDKWRNCLNWVSADEAEARMKRLIDQEDGVVAYGGTRRIKFRIIVRAVTEPQVWKEE